MTGPLQMGLLRLHVNQKPQLCLVLLLIIGLLLLSAVLPFVALQRQLTWVLFPGLGVDLLALDVSMFFDGSIQKFLVYYNPKPEDQELCITTCSQVNFGSTL